MVHGDEVLEPGVYTYTHRCVCGCVCLLLRRLNSSSTFFLPYPSDLRAKYPVLLGASDLCAAPMLCYGISTPGQGCTDKDLAKPQ